MADPVDTAEDDVINTGGGNDQVVSGTPGLDNGDTLDLGPGRNAVELYGSRLTGPPVRGGDAATLVLRDQTGPFSIDNVTGQILRDGAPWASLEGSFVEFYVRPSSGFGVPWVGPG